MNNLRKNDKTNRQRKHSNESINSSNPPQTQRSEIALNSIEHSFGQIVSQNSLSNNNSSDHNIREIEVPSHIHKEAVNPICPICLSRVQERAFTESCLHEFCFSCIEEWSRDHNRCPSPVAEPVINEFQGLLITLGIIGILLTPPDSGLYLINLIRTPHGVLYSQLFLSPNRINIYWEI